MAPETNILDDLKVNSARLVDVVLAFEDEFDIEIADEDVDAVETVADCVSLIQQKLPLGARGLRDEAAALPPLSARGATPLARQRRVSRLLSPVWVPLSAALMYAGMGWRIESARELRERYRRLRAESRAPLLVCANHLTLVDSFLVAWALGSPLWYLRHFPSLPWNLPEERNFAARWWQPRPRLRS